MPATDTATAADEEAFDHDSYATEPVTELSEETKTMFKGVFDQ